MDIETIRGFCLSLPFVTEAFPFDHSTLVFKVGGKLFALIDVDSFSFINLKCEPEIAIELRERFDVVRPCYHMNKKHWNTLVLNTRLSSSLVQTLIRESYALVKK